MWIGRAGIYRAHGLRVNPRLRMLKTVYKANIDIIHVQRDETSSLFSVSERISAGADSHFGSDSQADEPMTGDNVSPASAALCCPWLHKHWGPPANYVPLL
jgi:hypothetical protein